MARRGDVEARLRFGVRSLRGIGGLVPAVLAASGATPRSLGSRRGWDDAFAAIRARHPQHPGCPPALAHRGVPSRSLVLAHAAFTRLVDRFPGLPTSPGLPAPPSEYALWQAVRRLCPDPAMEGPDRHRDGISAYRGMAVVAAHAGLRLADLVDPLDVATALARVRTGPCRRLEGVPRDWRMTTAYALADPGADVVAMAHARAGTAGMDIPVTVLRAFRSEVRRAALPTRVRLPASRTWHRDPAVAAAMGDASDAWCLRHAAWHVPGGGGDPWRTALVRRTDGGHLAYVMAHDGGVTRREVAGPPLADAGRAGLRLAVAAALGTPPVPCAGRHATGLLAAPDVFGFAASDDPDDPRADVCDALSTAVAGLPGGVRKSFAYRVRALCDGLSNQACIAFEEAADPDVLALAAHALRGVDNVKREGGGRTAALSARIGALALVCGHRDRVAVLAAVGRVPLLASVAGCHGAWRGASDLASEGSRDGAALARMAKDEVGWPVGKAVVKAMRAAGDGRVHPGGPSRPAHEVVAEVAATLAAAGPSRPVPGRDEAVSISVACHVLGLAPVRDDPFATLAVARVLGGIPAEGGHDGAAHGLVDLWAWFGRQAGRLGLDPVQVRSLREDCLLHGGRTGPALARLSAGWHRDVRRLVRERDALLAELSDGERRAAAPGSVPVDFPGPFEAPFAVGTVEVVPLRDAAAFMAEAERQSSCVSGYVDEARTGRLMVLSLRSAAGWSTSGHWLESVHGTVRATLFQHSGDQAGGHARAAPPDAHVDVLAEVERMMAREEGAAAPGWRARASEARLAHDAIAATGREEALSEASRARLRALDLAHLRPYLGHAASTLDAEGLARHAEGLALARVAALAALRARLGVTAPG